MGGRPAILFGDRLNRSIYRLLRLAPFRTERDPIEPGEWLLRRVPGNADYYDPAKKIPLASQAFNPNKQDLDGISLFRELFTSPRSLSATGRKPPYYVVRLRAHDVNAIGLSLHPSPDADQPEGHLVIPELCYIAKATAEQKQNAERLRIALKNLAELAFDPNAKHWTQRLQTILRRGPVPVLVLCTIAGG